jgi:hypothetical protein
MKEAPEPVLDPHPLAWFEFKSKMGWYGFRSLSLPLFRCTRRQYPSIQRFRPFTMATAEVQKVNTTQRLQALRELMAQEKYDVNALIVPSEDQRTI